jgi:hypothetical protein
VKPEPLTGAGPLAASRRSLIVPADQVRVQPQHSIAHARELAISPRIRASAAGVVAAIYFHAIRAEGVMHALSGLVAVPGARATPNFTSELS